MLTLIEPTVLAAAADFSIITLELPGSFVYHVSSILRKLS